MTHKKMLTTTELIQHLKKKNVTFNYVNVSEAQHMIDTTNYYFKLSSYRKNFPEDEKGRYLNLDFAYLTDLASIDEQLREFLLELTLDVEHGVKTFLISVIANDVGEDGYNVVKAFKNKFPSQYNRAIVQFRNNKYFLDLYQKYHNDLPIWVFMEIISFGTLSQFVDFYYESHRFKKLKQVHHHLKFCKNIRNACAHSDPILINLFSDKEFVARPSSAVISAGYSMHISRQYLQDVKINDLTATFYLHKKFQSVKLAEHRVREGKRVIARFNRHQKWYLENSILNAFFSILNKQIDYLAS